MRLLFGQVKYIITDGNIFVPWQFRNGILARDDYQGEYHNQLVYQVARGVSLEAPAKSVSLPESVTETYIDDVVRRMLAAVSA